MTLTRRLFAVALAAALSSACSPSASPDPEEADLSPSPSAASPSPSPEPEAADGTDLEACADGVCEVYVSEGDVIELDGDQRIGRLTFSTVSPTEIAVAGAPADAPDTDLFFVSGDPSGPGGLEGSAYHSLNELGLWYLAVDDGVIVRMAPVDPPSED